MQEGTPRTAQQRRRLATEWHCQDWLLSSAAKMHHPERQRRLHRQRRRHCVRGELKRLRVRAKTVAHCTEKLQACVGAGVEPLDAGFDARVVLDVAFLFWTANGESVPDPLHIRHVVCCNVLQVFYEGEKVRV